MRIRAGESRDTECLLEVWRDSVEATHDFLNPEDVEFYRPQVEKYLFELEVWVAADGVADRPVGFIGLDGNKVEMLFIHSGQRGKGLGRSLLEYARSLKGTLSLDVNEQNSQARGFYLKLGFREVGRAELDGSGRPFPLIHMTDRAEE